MTVFMWVLTGLVVVLAVGGLVIALFFGPEDRMDDAAAFASFLTA